MSEQEIAVFDLDGTLCEQVDTRTSPLGILAYGQAAPRRDVIDKLNEMSDGGWKIVIHTARGMRTFGGDVPKVEGALRSMTEQWLADNGVRYHELIFGKPPGSLYVDDRGQSVGMFLWNRRKKNY